MCVRVAGQSPAHIRILNEYGALLEFGVEAIASTVIKELSHET